LPSSFHPATKKHIVYGYGSDHVDALNRLRDNHDIDIDKLELLGLIDADLHTEIEMDDGVIFFGKWLH